MIFYIFELTDIWINVFESSTAPRHDRQAFGIVSHPEPDKINKRVVEYDTLELQKGISSRMRLLWSLAYLILYTG